MNDELEGEDLGGGRAGNPLTRALHFLEAVVHRFRGDGGLRTAGSLTFTTLLSLVPMITVVLALATAFPVFDRAMEAFQMYLVRNVLPDAAVVRTITEHIADFTQRAGRLTELGLAVLAVTSIMLMMTIEEALNKIFRVRRRRPLMHRILIYWGVLTLGPLLIGASLYMTSFLVARSLGYLNLSEWVATALRLVPFLFTCAAFTLLYAVVPHRHVRPRHALFGGLLAGVAFEAAKRGFGLYVAAIPTYKLVYGAFAAFPIFLVWLYLSWLIVLAGATIASLAPGYSSLGQRRRVAGHDFVEALTVLDVLAAAQFAGETKPLRAIAADARIAPERCEELLERCAALGWAAETERERWVLAWNAGRIRVADVYRAFTLDPRIGEEAAAMPPGLPALLAEHWRQVDGQFSLTLAERVDSKGRGQG